MLKRDKIQYPCEYVRVVFAYVDEYRTGLNRISELNINEH